MLQAQSHGSSVAESSQLRGHEEMTEPEQETAQQRVARLRTAFEKATREEAVGEKVAATTAQPARTE